LKSEASLNAALPTDVFYENFHPINVLKNKSHPSPEAWSTALGGKLSGNGRVELATLKNAKRLSWNAWSSSVLITVNV
jgi:hypothetical protein